MARLAELEERMLRGGGGGAGDVAEAPVERERRILRIYFGIGLACSGVAGSVALLVMLALAAGPAHERWFGSGEANSPLVLYDALPRPPARPVPAKLTTIEMLIPRSERGGARLPLERAGRDLLEAQRSDGFVAVLRNVPQSVSLSRGVRENAQTWRLNKGDLQHLYLSLGHDAPDVFAFNLDVGASQNSAKPTAIVQVRLVEAQQGTQPAAQPVATPKPAAPAPGVKVSAGAAERAERQPRTPEAPAATVRAKTPRAAEPPAPKIASMATLPVPLAKEAPMVEFAKSDVARPHGMSGLGGPGASSAQAAPDASLFGRQVWWRLPPAPAWSPFKEAGVR